jgi:uncharacterized membrane protein
MTVWGGALLSIATGLVSAWPVVALLLAGVFFLAVLWNVITVSFRQSIIPDRLLGRVNSVYRFFGWGAISIGGLLGGIVVAALEGPLSRESALRAVWIISGVAQLAVALYAMPRLTTAKMDAARAAAVPAAAALDT